MQMRYSCWQWRRQRLPAAAQLTAQQTSTGSSCWPWVVLLALKPLSAQMLFGCCARSSWHACRQEHLVERLRQPRGARMALLGY